MKTSNFGSKLSDEIRYFWHEFTKTLFPIENLKIKSQLPNLTSNFETHKNFGDNFLLPIQLDIYIICLPTNYEEN